MSIGQRTTGIAKGANRVFTAGRIHERRYENQLLAILHLIPGDKTRSKRCSPDTFGGTAEEPDWPSTTRELSK